ncbi:MAG: hypothetical protein IJI35_15830 [Kiritimatiellae bacterium]|nr:hypothetical protein [Kiritimatiellia bacterium]
MESANIVGYKGISSGENLSPVMGGVFEPVNGASTYDLRDCQIVGDEGEYCDPGNEYLRVLNPNSLATTVRYTYVSREWMVDNFDDDSVADCCQQVHARHGLLRRPRSECRCQHLQPAHHDCRTWWV